MGRGVSVPTNAEIVTYIDMSDMSQEDYDMYIENLVENLRDKLPSLHRCEEWLGREDRGLLENDFVFIGVSIYMDVISLWIVPKDYYPQLTYNWINKIAHHVTKLGDLTKQGTMSNGVSVYSKKVQE